MGQEVTEKEMLKSLGEIRLMVGALLDRVELLESRCDRIEMNHHIARKRALRGRIQGLEGEWTVTPPPEFAGFPPP